MSSSARLRLFVVASLAWCCCRSPLAMAGPAGGGGGDRGRVDCGPGRFKDATCRCHPCPDCSDFYKEDTSNGTTTAATGGTTLPPAAVAVVVAVVANGNGTAATTTLPPAEQRRQEICRKQAVCRGEPAAATHCRRLLLVSDRSALEPMGLGTAAGIVCCISLVGVAAYFGRRRCLQRRGRSSSSRKDDEAGAGDEDEINLRQEDEPPAGDA